MSQVQESIDVDVPVSTAYNQWTQFESFPQFMEGVESITQVTDTLNRWVTTVGGQRREFNTEITEQHPDERIAWRSVGGDVHHAGVVTFHRLSDTTTRVMIQIDWEPSDAKEKVGSALGFDTRQVKADAARFKEFIEKRGVESGGWRGDVDNPS
ncbi:SRPBCC family protein [Georgenia phoenicis]|uniref:SRPBCC family protein n=1 Tax=unclassified Georgenia TaxID=2626815 RepID=UPI0039AFF9F1